MSQSHLKGSGSVKYVSVSFFDRRSDPFKSLTSISPEEAREVIERIKVERPDSLVLLITYGDTRFLFTGDI